MKKVEEFSPRVISGYAGLLLHSMVFAAVIALAVITDRTQNEAWVILLVPTVAFAGILFRGYFTVEPNSSKSLVLFGKYTGTVRRDGFWFANPFTIRKRVSLRVRNFTSEQLKVNDEGGNPIEIAAVVVWRVTDAARALFDADDYVEFVEIQTETALRGLASRYPYDSHEDDEMSLRGSQMKVAETLKEQLEERLQIAGVEILESRISHLAYAPEIAQAMLRRQQAQAIIAARTQIVEGAVGMVKMALQHLADEDIVELDEERKATMVNNLLVVLTSEQESQPVLNAGTLY